MEKKTLGSVATYINGRAFKPAEWEQSGLPIIRIQNLTDERASYNYSSKDFEEKYRVVTGDLLFAWSASLGAHIWKKGDAWLNQHIFKIVPNNDIDKFYLYYYLKKVTADLYAKTHGTGMVHITKKPFMSTSIPVPSIEEQQRIVSRIEELFSELDKGVETLQTIKQQLAVYRQAVLKEAFECIENAEHCQFGDVLEEKPRNGYSPKGVNYQTAYKNLTLTATTSGRFRENCFKYVDIDIDDDSYLWVRHDDILIQRANTIEYVGTAVLYRGDDKKYVYPDLMMKCHAKNGMLPQFLVYQLQSPVCKAHFRKLATGTAGSMPKINQKAVMTAPIIVMSYEDQTRIVEEIESRLSVCDSIEQTVDTALAQAEAMRQSILKKAFEGGFSE